MTDRKPRRAGALHRWCYRRLLWLFPAWFRNAHGRQMSDDFTDLLEECGPGSGRARAWIIALADVVRSAPAVWLHGRAPFRPAGGTRRTREMTRIMIRDIQLALRTSLRTPAFMAIVVATLAIGIGGTVAMFSVADGVLFGTLPYKDADRLAMIWNRHPANGSVKVQISGPDLLDYRDRTTSFEAFAFIHNATDNSLTDGARAEQVDVGYVSANFFTFLGVDPVVGRTFDQRGGPVDETSMDQVGPAVISHDLWSRRYGGDPSAVGRRVFLSGTPVEIVGVLPAGFRLLLPYARGGAMSAGANDTIDVWRVLPERSFPAMPRSMAVVRVIGRLAPGVTIAQARQEFDRLAADLRREHSVHRDRETAIDIVPMHSEVVGHVRTAIVSLFGGVAVVLLIACANVATLISVQGTQRRRDVAMRLALGASRPRIVWQLFAESLVLAAAAGVLGVALAAGLIRVITALAPPDVPMLDRVALDVRAVGFALLVATVTTVVFGLWPAVRASRVPAAAQLAGGSRTAIGHGRRFRSVTVALEIALSVVLLAAGGLLVRSFIETQRAGLGFEPEAVLTAKLSLGHGKYNDEALRRRYWDELQQALEAHPAIDRAGLVWPLPFTGQGVEVPYDSRAGDAPDWGRFVAFTSNALPGYFEAMNAEVLEGRVFDVRDLDRAGELAVIDDVAAGQLFPDSRAVGRTIWIEDFTTGERRPVEVLGVIRHIRHSELTGPEREVIYRQNPAARNLAVVVRSRAGADVIGAELRRLTGELDPDVPIFDTQALAGYVDSRVAPTRFTMTLAASFGLVALLMAMVGLYGVIAYAVTQRTTEIGLRMALGAGEASIMRLILGQGVLLAGIGLAAGLGLALAVMGAIRGLLVAVPVSDPVTLAAASTLLVAAALAACYVPARRAARLDPALTLRGE